MSHFGYLELKTTDPAWNLAAEQYVFDCFPQDRSYLMLWQNEKAIIVGKYQNTAAEIHADYVKQHGIRVVRRLSGGGAVYHDLGNLNFTVICNVDASEAVNLHLFCEPVVRALARLGVTAEINGRNDITVAGKKFSGNAQYRKNGRVMHHGTILFDSDLSEVQRALQVNAEKIRSKGVSSVRSRITNLKPFLPEGTTLEAFRKALRMEITAGNPTEQIDFSAEDELFIEKLRQERYLSRAWNYGASPACTLLKRARIEGCGCLEIYLTIEKDRITDIKLSGDFFAVEEPAILERAVLGAVPERESCEKALRGSNIHTEEIIVGLSEKDFLTLLCGE